MIGSSIPSLRYGSDEAGIRESLLAGTSYCTYPGVGSASFPTTGGTVKLIVPWGSQRLVQVLGIEDGGGGACSAANPLLHSIQNSQSTAYEIGRGVIDLFADRTMTIIDSYDGLSGSQQQARVADCDENSCASGNLAESQTATNASTQVGLTFTSLAQAFTVATTGKIQSLVLKLSYSASSAIARVAVHTDSSGAPGALVSTANMLSVTSGTATNYTFNFPAGSEPNVTAGAKYWIVLTNDTAPNIIWSGVTTDAYRPGSAYDARGYNGSSWVTVSSFDFYFQVLTCN